MDNFTIACDVCNTMKGESEGLVDPYIDDLTGCFKFRGCMICAVPDNEKSRVTVVVLDLNRTPLLERRKDKIDELNLRLAEILQMQDVNNRRLLAQALINHARSAEQHYTACATEFITQLKAEGYLPHDLN